MKILELRKVLNSLIFGCIASMILLYIELKRFDYIDLAEFPLIPVLLLHALFFSIVFLYTSLLLQMKRENLKEGNRLKAFEKLGMALQILLTMLTVSIVFLPILGNFFFVFSILLVCIGAFLYYRTKSKRSGSLVLWGLAMLVLTYLMNIFVYGIENCII